ncbi:twin transmembrane helix small protein [Ancylobacter terrae]|uniref:twin transmembrane helix small protein n=1 Tax=Ancylobacter sp. sgz301288 TaxID=3342077 RepID=UPI00385A149D
MDVLYIAKFFVLPVALGAVAVVLLLGLTNLVKGGSPQRSQMLMRWRVGLQFLALCLVLGTILIMQHS